MNQHVMEFQVDYETLPEGMKHDARIQGDGSLHLISRSYSLEIMDYENSALGGSKIFAVRGRGKPHLAIPEVVKVDDRGASSDSREPHTAGAIWLAGSRRCSWRTVFNLLIACSVLHGWRIDQRGVPLDILLGTIA